MQTFFYRGGQLELTGHTAIMGILNVTPDSFSDGGCFASVEAAVTRALTIEQEGAAILDVGAQSTRPGHKPVSAAEECARLLPVLEQLQGRLSIPISVDTYYPEVAQAALDRGAAILNDVSGGIENGMAALAARSGAGLVMMYPGRDDAQAGDIVTDTAAFFHRALNCARAAGLPLARVCLDPGIGFGRTREEDLRTIAALPAILQGLPEVPVLVGASRKRVVAACGGNVAVDQRLPGTLALHSAAQWNGARLLRVHDVAEAVQAAQVIDRVLAAR